MVAGDEIGKDVSDGAEGYFRLLGTGSGVIGARDFVAETLLEFLRELSEIVPEAGEVAPLAGGFAVAALGEHFGGELGCEVGDLVEVAVVAGEVVAMLAEGAVFAGAGGGGITTRRRRRAMTGRLVVPRGEEGFPLGWVIRVIRMGVGIGGGGHLS